VFENVRYAGESYQASAAREIEQVRRGGGVRAFLLAHQLADFDNLLSE